jgi:hypothetical protein
MNSTVQKMNSMLPFATNVPKANTNVSKGINSFMNMGFNKNTSSNVSASSAVSSWNTPLVWFMVFLLGFLGLFAYYYEPFMNSIQNWTDSINMWFTGRGGPPQEPEKDIPTKAPVAPQDESATQPTGMSSVVEKMLPPAKDVFTVSKNDYTFYDAAPLCKALGAELATYEQVKQAWQKGADWCNYGWVKGQMAVYPTQNSTYEELQQGPDDQKGACGKPGLNGGYFDNPELKFGVTCIGNKPMQSKHDANAISAGSTRPLTASGLEFEKKVMRFKEGSENIGILPFNKERWD